jgi:hypothetical protein
MLDAKDILQTTYKSVLLESAVASGLHTDDLELDSNYDVCDGIQVTEVDDGGIADGDYTVSVTNNNGTPLPEIPIQSIATGKADGTTPNDRYLDVLFDSKSGKSVKVLANLPGAPSSAVKVRFTFRLRRLLTPLRLPN